MFLVGFLAGLFSLGFVLFIIKRTKNSKSDSQTGGHIDDTPDDNTEKPNDGIV